MPTHRGIPLAIATHLAKTFLKHLDVARGHSRNDNLNNHSRRASAHAGHDPPQSAPASSPFWVPSEHVGPGMWPASEWQRSSGSDTLEFVQSGRHDPARHDRQPRDPTRSDPTRPDTTPRSAITVAGRRVAVFGVAHREQRTPPGISPSRSRGPKTKRPQTKRTPLDREAARREVRTYLH